MTQSVVCRWLVEGRLKTASWLRIGSGDCTRSHPRLRQGVELDSDPVWVNTVLTDHEGKPFIPGSSLKGVLRGWLAGVKQAQPVLDELMGTENAEDPAAVGGCAEIENAYLQRDQTLPDNVIWADPTRHTGVRVGIARDVATLTVLEDRLYHEEFVPPGVAFNVRVVLSTAIEQWVAWLCAALDAFNTNERMRLGADTGMGYGRMAWQRKKLHRYGAQELDAWLKRIRRGDCVAWNVHAGHEVTALVIPQCAPASAWKPLELDVQLDAPFLCNDPEPAIRKARREQDFEQATDFNPRRLPDGRPYLPGHSVKGALRGQAERILRTLGVHVCDRRSPCKPCRAPADSDDLCLACQMFGNAGWGGSVAADDFVLVAPSSGYDPKQHDHHQEFVAIDRFRGGVAGSAKFNATAAAPAVLRGKLWIDTKRTGSLDAWMAGLILRVMRDLAEGDIALGYGRNKGYGAVRSVTATSAMAGSQVIADWLSHLLPADGRDPIAALRSAISRQLQRRGDS